MNKEQKKVEQSVQDDEPPRSFLARLFSASPKSRKSEIEANGSNGASQLNLAPLNHIRVSDIAIPKADIVALSIHTKLDDFFEVLSQHGYSRLPIFKETLDDPLGLVHIKDVFMTFGTDLETENFSLEPFARELIYVPPSMGVLKLLQRMQSEHVHMALVIDEYGGVDGLVTIEDILEEIVGDITDEHDEQEEAQWQLEKPGLYSVSARAQIDEFMEDTGVDLSLPEDADDVDTIGGLVMTIAGRVPVRDEVIRAENGVEFEIVEADPRRIKRVRIRPNLLHQSS